MRALPESSFILESFCKCSILSDLKCVPHDDIAKSLKTKANLLSTEDFLLCSPLVLRVSATHAIKE